MVGPQEVILILIILLVVVGPQKLPNIAKELGKVIVEFNKARAGITNIARSALNSDDENEEGEMVTNIARNLGLHVEGKSTKQLLKEVEGKMVNREDSDNQEKR